MPDHLHGLFSFPPSDNPLRLVVSKWKEWTAKELGILTTTPAVGALAGKKILAGMNSTLASSLNGGAGISGDGQITLTDPGSEAALAFEALAKAVESMGPSRIYKSELKIG